MKISLVTIAAATDSPYYFQPIRGCEHGGISALASFLRRAEHTTQVIDGAALSLALPEVLSRLVAFNADVVGFSPTLASMKEALKLSDDVKQWASPPVVIMGGHHATLCAEAILAAEHTVDFIFCGEAENSLVDFLENLKDGDLDEINGIICRRRVGMQQKASCAVVEDLDQLPHSDRDTLCELKEHSPIVGTTIQSSRGCPFNCTFCTSPIFYQNGPKYRKHSPQYVADEMERVCKEHDVHLFNFTDDLFLPAGKTHMNWGYEFANEVTRRRLAVAFSVMVRAELFQPKYSELFHHLKKAGLHQVLIGIENVSHKSLSKYNKGTKVSDYVTAVGCLESIDTFLVSAFINLNPFLTRKDFLRNVDFLSNIVKDPTMFQYISRLVVFPGTPMEKLLRKEELLVDTGRPYVDGLNYRFLDPSVQVLADGFESVSGAPFPADSLIEEIQHLMAHSRAVDILSNHEYCDLFKHTRRLRKALSKNHSAIMRKCINLADTLDSKAIADTIKSYYASSHDGILKNLSALKNELQNTATSFTSIGLDQGLAQHRHQQGSAHP
jgi:anaerobic magnesium-protoporphyrin IX monomethyl ester cyclase